MPFGNKKKKKKKTLSRHTLQTEVNIFSDRKSKEKPWKKQTKKQANKRINRGARVGKLWMFRVIDEDVGRFLGLQSTPAK